MNPFFSIIIPTLNEEQFLPHLLSNLARQKKKNFEVIVVDAHSEDKTKKVALSYGERIPLLFLRNESKNVSKQRNKGAYRAKGSYLIFLDADSQINSFFTLKLEKRINKKKGLFFIPRIRINSSDPDIKIAVDLFNMSFEASQIINRPFALGAAMIMEKNYFNTIKGFDEKLTFGEDYDLARRSLQWNVRIRFLPDVAVTYSLRRVLKEGKLKAYYKYLISTIKYLVHGKTDRKLFEYEMGGHLYKNIKTINDKSSSNYFEHLFKQAKSAFVKFFKE